MRKPCPGSPRTFSTGTCVLSKYTSAVGEHLMPIFFSGGPLVTPPKSRSTMNAVTLSRVPPGAVGSGTGVWANTVNTEAMLPLLIHSLPPAQPSANNDVELASRSGNQSVGWQSSRAKKGGISQSSQ